MVRQIHSYTEEEKNFLREYVPGHSHMEIRDAFEREFGWPISISQVKSSIMRYGLNTGRNGQFEKGQTAHNKGKKMPAEVYEKCRGTMFKKGDRPKTYRPVGSERVNVYGYLEIKVKDPNKWRLKHNVVWEQHYGKIPDKHVVIFLNGNSMDTDISNLKLIRRSELLIMNRGNMKSGNPEVTESAVYLARLIDKTNAARKKKENS